MVCPVVKLSKIMGRKWSIPVFEEIAFEKFNGFNSFISRFPNITPRILSRQLKEMEDEDLIKKTFVKKQNQNITKYMLTAKGKEMQKIILEIKKWNMRWNKTSDTCLHTACSECQSSQKI
ncbi:MAG: helix-turn-helix domain-containing protein [Candidatus Aenigmarchaeota archaeon]|nr:helix-turn-helix domain-containing protein [Candidatus Aenigmarchaeota archaeon]